MNLSIFPRFKGLKAIIIHCEYDIFIEIFHFQIKRKEKTKKNEQRILNNLLINKRYRTMLHAL